MQPETDQERSGRAIRKTILRQIVHFGGTRKKSMVGERKTEVVRVITQRPSLDFMEDKAVTDFSAFGVVAAVHVKRVRSDYAINQMLDVLERLHSDLAAKIGLRNGETRVA